MACVVQEVKLDDHSGHFWPHNLLTLMREVSYLTLKGNEMHAVTYIFSLVSSVSFSLEENNTN